MGGTGRHWRHWEEDTNVVQLFQPRWSSQSSALGKVVKQDGFTISSRNGSHADKWAWSWLIAVPLRMSFVILGAYLAVACPSLILLSQALLLFFLDDLSRQHKSSPSSCLGVIKRKRKAQLFPDTICCVLCATWMIGR